MKRAEKLAIYAVKKAQAKVLFETTDYCTKEIAREIDAHPTTICQWARKEGWGKLEALPVQITTGWPASARFDAPGMMATNRQLQMEDNDYRAAYYETRGQIAAAM